VAFAGFRLGLGQGDVERGFGQVGHGLANGRHGGAGLHVLRGQALDDKLAGGAQGTGEVSAASQEVVDQRADVGAGRHPCANLRKVSELIRVAAADALHVARMRCIAGCRDGVKRKIEHGTARPAKGSVLGLPLVDHPGLLPC
jgi:hypothetical protein